MAKEGGKKRGGEEKGKLRIYISSLKSASVCGIILKSMGDTNKGVGSLIPVCQLQRQMCYGG